MPCVNCEVTYVGTTSQYLSKRISQHKSDCKGRDENKSALVSHHVSEGHHFDFGGVTILTVSVPTTNVG